MNAHERAMIAALHPGFQVFVWLLIAFAEKLLAGHSYRFSVTSYMQPWKGGNRTAAQQLAEFKAKRSKADGVKKRSKHQFPFLALHFGFRDRRNESIYYDPAKMRPAMLALFWVIVIEAERLGFVCGIRFEPIENGIGWDPEHFEAGPKMKLDAAQPSDVGMDKLYTGEAGEKDG